MADITAVQALEIVADAAHLKKRPLPDAPTGYYDWQIKPDHDDREAHSQFTNFINRAQSLESKGLFKPKISQVDAFIDTVRHPNAIDDRKGAFATGLGILARLDPHSDLANSMNNDVINTLYNTIPHPPASYLSANFTFRHADGGSNNLEYPDLGRAGTPYARSVQGKDGLPRTSLPDPNLVFNAILKRKGVQKHPGGMSSLIFAYALIVTHSLFRTDHRDISVNNASSYLDLSPLYGDNQAAQDKVRDRASGRGLLFPDTFSEERLLFAPPAASVLLVLFSRNHNFIARRLLQINERKRWFDPVPTDPAQLALQDEEIFQTARLVNCGHFMSTIKGDYVASFLGSSDGWDWDMKAFDVGPLITAPLDRSSDSPAKPIETKNVKVPRGLGNHVSIEFNILYRWHATLSENDEKWTNDLFKSIFGDKPFEDLTLEDLRTLASVLADVPSNPAERIFAGLTRGADGTFNDDKLAEILHAAIEEPAGSFRGRGIPPVLRLIEIMGIEQSRAWGVCTMNEFRKFLGLKAFKTFEDWNPDPDIAAGARRLYGHVDNLELYPGLQAEATMPVSDGLAFACGYTTTRGVLGDAVALIRGDRFYTSNFTANNLTTWGFQDCQRDKNNGGLGGMIPKLLLRHLPRHFPWNSVYSLYPFFTPDKMKTGLTRRKLEKKYTFDPPKVQQVPKVLNTFTAIKNVFNDPSRFKVIYEKHGYGSVLMFDEIAKHDNDKAMVIHAFFPTPESLETYAHWFAESITKKVKEKAWQYPGVAGNYVDIVKDVINVVCAHFSADKLTGADLKTKNNPSGIFTENEYFDMLAILYTTGILAFDEPESSFALHESSAQYGAVISGLIAKSILEISPSASPNFFGKVIATVASMIWPANKKEWYPFLSALAATGRPIDELIGNIIGVAVGSSVNYAHAAVNVIDFYLDDARSSERQAIVELAASQSPENDALLRGYVCEAMRLKPQFPGIWREALVDASIEQGPGLPPLDIKAGDRIWASFRNAHRNPLDFPEPTKINPRRPLASYHLNGTGFHICAGATYAQLTIVAIVKSVFRLKNVRRAPGDAGKLHSFSETVHETETDFFIQRNGTVSPWPGSMNIIFDD